MFPRTIPEALDHATGRYIHDNDRVGFVADWVDLALCKYLDTGFAGQDDKINTTNLLAVIEMFIKGQAAIGRLVDEKAKPILMAGIAAGCTQVIDRRYADRFSSPADMLQFISGCFTKDTA